MDGKLDSESPWVGMEVIVGISLLVVMHKRVVSQMTVAMLIIRLHQ